MFPDTKTLHISWSFNHKKPKSRFAPIPASPGTSLSKITSLTLDFRGQIGNKAFSTYDIPMILQHLHMPNVRQLALYIQPSDQKQFLDDGEWKRVKKVCEWIEMPGMERFHLGLHIPVIKDVEGGNIWVSPRFEHPPFTLTLIIHENRTHSRRVLTDVSIKRSARS
jgi:hypothetical protein